jgi:hypothetical protein
MADWKVERGPKRCAVTDRPFEEGEAYYSALAEEDGMPVRQDYSLEAWPEVKKDAFIAFWRTRLPAAGEPPRRRLVDTEVIHTLFTHLEDDPVPEKITFRYLLALILVRKRVLRLDDIVREGGREYLAVRDRRAGTDLRVLNPEADAETLAAAQQELSAIFDMDFEAAENAEENGETGDEERAEAAAGTDSSPPGG